MAGAAAATVLILSLPSPAAAAPTPSVTISDVTVTEGTGAAVTAAFTIQVAPPPKACCSIQVSWATAPGSASAPGDYTTSSGTVTLSKSATSRVVSVPIAGDATDEFTETFVVNLTNLVGTPGQISDPQGVGTITDNDAPPTLSVGDVSVTEGNAGTVTATFIVSLSAASGKTVTVDWATADLDATQPVDYAAGSGTLTFLPADTSETLTVSVNGDGVAELDETFRVTLTAPVEATLADATGTGTIVDDELEPVIDINEPTALEGDGVIAFSVTLSHQSGSPVTVDWTTAAGTASNGPDYFDTNGTVTFAPLETLKTVEITVNDDGTYELDETVAVNLSDPAGAPIGDAQGIGTIANDDGAPGLSVADVSVAEGNSGQKMLTFTVALAGATDVDATVDWSTLASTATNGSDYIDTSGMLTIPAGETGTTVQAVVNGDTVYEADETLSLMLADPAHATLSDGTAIGTIQNDDKAPTALTLVVSKAPKSLTAKGVMERAKAGLKVTATLYKKEGGRFVKVIAKTARIRDVRDRDLDGKPDGSYTTTFVRPKTQGTYKVVVRFKGTAAFKPCSRTKIFTLPAT